LEYSLHALQYPSCRLGLRKPDRGQHVEDLPSFDLSNWPITNAREDVGIHCRLPLSGMLCVREGLPLRGKKDFERSTKSYAARRRALSRASIGSIPSSRCCRSGGWGGIRTPGEREPTPVFKTGALNHSATHPSSQRQSS